jgi:hypothetical protein
MKNAVKLFGIAVITAMLLAGCWDDLYGGAGNGGTTGDGSGTGGGGGVTWTAVSNSTFGTSAIAAIAYGNNKFVAGGQNGKMATSTNN